MPIDDDWLFPRDPYRIPTEPTERERLKRRAQKILDAAK